MAESDKSRPNAREGSPEVVLRIRNLSKTFPGTRALKGVSFDVHRAEVHALLGHNGSGKSTLIKVLAGLHDPDQGSEIFVNDAPLSSLRDTPGYPLRFVHQELGLVLELNAIDNLALQGGYISDALGRIKWSKQKALTERLLARFDVQFDVTRPLSEAAPVERTVLAIASALENWDEFHGVLVLDEPTAVLPHHEVARLLELIREIRSAGLSVLYVSHRLDEIIEVADTITVLRDGEHVITRPVAGLDKSGLIGLMLGSEEDGASELRPSALSAGDVVVQAERITGRFLTGASITLRAGEIVGLAGLPGSGREELPYVLAGSHDHPVTGRIAFGGGQLRPIPSADQRQVVLVPADRATEGLIKEMSVCENVSLSVLDRLSRNGRLNSRAERDLASEWIERLAVASPGLDYPIGSLSGGSQQKILIGRCLARDPKVLVLCEPTTGVDVGARRTIHEFLLQLAQSGLTIVVSSTDIDDLVATCSRVLILRQGVVVDEIVRQAISESSIVSAIEETDAVLA